jgi:hypothetical protein
MFEFNLGAHLGFILKLPHNPLVLVGEGKEYVQSLLQFMVFQMVSS